MPGCEFAPRCPWQTMPAPPPARYQHVISAGHWSACHRPEQTASITTPPLMADRADAQLGDTLVLKASALGKTYRQRRLAGSRATGRGPAGD